VGRIGGDGEGSGGPAMKESLCAPECVRDKGLHVVLVVCPLAGHLPWLLLIRWRMIDWLVMRIRRGIKWLSRLSVVGATQVPSSTVHDEEY
jgi:hypothetical protein